MPCKEQSVCACLFFSCSSVKGAPGASAAAPPHPPTHPPTCTSAPELNRRTFILIVQLYILIEGKACVGVQVRFVSIDKQDMF